MSKDHPSDRSPQPNHKTDDELTAFGPLLDEVRDAARGVNSVADRASARVQAVDRALAEAGVGLEVWYAEVHFYDKAYLGGDPADPEEVGRETILIGYAKVRNVWGLALKRTVVDDVEPTVTQVTLLRDADRETRIKALSYLPAVLKTVTAALRQHKVVLENTMGAE